MGVCLREMMLNVFFDWFEALDVGIALHG